MNKPMKVCQPAPAVEAVLDQLESIAREQFSQRAERYDDDASFPFENFDDLFAIGALGASFDPKFGGLGCSPTYGKVDKLWHMTRSIARADLSFARCWEGHNNALMLIDRLANSTQKQRWFMDVINKGHRWAAWSGEPQTRLPGQKYQIGTEITPATDGFIINGNKVFATSAPGANRAILLVSLEGPGGAREVKDGENNLLMLACDLSDPSISFDGDWWDPIGMRSTLSIKVNFDNTFIRSEDCIGEVGEFITRDMQSRFTPHYAVSFLGALEGAYDYTVSAIASQQRQQDPYVQHHVALIKMHIETLTLWTEKVANLLNHKQFDSAKVAASQFRYLAQQLSEDGVKQCIQICGARALNKPSPLERIYRDLTMYVLHDNVDNILATIGRRELGLSVDSSFFSLKA